MSMPLWVFGYASLMWRPGFSFEERVRARLHGYHRALCVASLHYRGTEQDPGLVMGLNLGGSCRGVAFRVADRAREETLAYLRERERMTGVYLEVWKTVRLLPARAAVTAVFYVANRDHEQFKPDLDFEEQVTRVLRCTGWHGSNVDYVCHTADMLQAEFGSVDGPIGRVADEVRRRLAGSGTVQAQRL